MTPSGIRERTRFIRFALVGTLGAAIDFSVFNLAIQMFGIKPVWANVISFSVAVVSNFIWNRFWTFPDSRTKPIRRQLAGVMIRTPMFVLLEPFWVRFFSGPARGWIPGLGFLSPEVVGHNLALGLAMIVVLFWNFFVNRYWTYADVAVPKKSAVSEY